MDGNKSNQFVKSALVLTLAGIISKLLSAGYRIPLQNLTGDLGFYIYQQVYPFLGCALILSLYGFPSAISKMAAELRAEGKTLSFISFYIPVFSILLIINGGLFLLVFLYAHSIAGWMGDPDLEWALQYASFTFLLIPFSSLLRGVFQGSGQMRPTAYSQVVEQLCRVFIILFAAILLVTQGANIYSIGQAAAIAAIIGAVTAIFVLGIFFIKQKPYESDPFVIPWKYYFKMLLMFGIIATINHMVLLVIQFADAFTLVPGLMELGLPQSEAMKMKGIFDRGQPLIQLGTVLGSSFALALIPALTSIKLKNEPDDFYHYIQSSLLFSLYLATGATIGLIVIFPEANILLYQNASGTGSLRILTIAILLSSLAITVSSILQGLNYMKQTAVFIFIAFIVKWGANQLLVPLWGINGSAIATVLGLFVLYLLAITALKRKLPKLSLIKQINWRALVLACFGMTVYIMTGNFFVPFETLSRGLLLLYVLFITLSGAAIYLFVLLRCQAFTERQIMMLPFAQWLIRVQRGRDLNG